MDHVCRLDTDTSFISMQGSRHKHSDTVVLTTLEIPVNVNNECISHCNFTSIPAGSLLSVSVLKFTKVLLWCISMSSLMEHSKGCKKGFVAAKGVLYSWLSGSHFWQFWVLALPRSVPLPPLLLSCHFWNHSTAASWLSLQPGQVTSWFSLVGDSFKVSLHK